MAVIALSVIGFTSGVEPAGATPLVPHAAEGRVQVAGTAPGTLGLVKTTKETSIAWVGAQGVVVTSNQVADTVGADASFEPFGSTDTYSCWTAEVVPSHRLSVLRCADLTTPGLSLAAGAGLPGAPSTAVFLTLQDTPSTVGGALVDRISFMRGRQPRFSFVSPGFMEGNRDLIGAPVVDAQGRVASMLYAIPETGGGALGLTRDQIAEPLAAAAQLPASFNVAAIRSIGRRTLIPVLVGLVIGALWAWRSTSQRRGAKVVGPAIIAFLAVLAIAVFQAVVVGPGSLIA